MPFIYFLKVYLLTTLSILAVDAVWLLLVAKKFYDSAFIGFERTLRAFPALLVYILIPLGLVVFVLPKANGNPIMGAMYGVLFGLIGYGIYDLTNYALFSQWTLKLTMIDMIWGAFLSGLISFLMVLNANNLK